ILVEYADALAYDGRPERSVELVQRGMRLNPFHPDWYLWFLADAYSLLHQHEDVIATVGKMRNPTQGRRLLAASLAHTGRIEEARRQAQEILRAQPGFSIANWRERPPIRLAEAMEELVAGLRMAGLPK